VRLVQLRAKALPRPRYEELARAAVPLCHDHGAQVLLNSDPDLVETTGADGVHLNSARLGTLTARPLPERRYWIAASCHNMDEVRKAERIGADFVVLAPVLPTRSHPEAVPLGWDRLRRITEQARLPVFALGGMKPAHLAQCYAAGAQGIAAIRSLWGDET
jgi:8-oxo-dGTP diphosphatase